MLNTKMTRILTGLTWSRNSSKSASEFKYTVICFTELINKY